MTAFRLRHFCFQHLLACLAFAITFVGHTVTADEPTIEQPPPSEVLSLNQLKQRMAQQSSYLGQQANKPLPAAPEPQLQRFQDKVLPALTAACIDCHGPDEQEGHIRIDTLDPDLIHGQDVQWWLEVMAVLGKGEMPPADAAELADEDREQIVNWLSSELQTASAVRRSEQGHSSFRRMTRYEYNHALQDLLGLPFDFASDLPPESRSEDGFQNSSELLHLTQVQLETYRQSAFKALNLAVVKGDRPASNYWGVSMDEAAKTCWDQQNGKLAKAKKDHQADPEKLADEIERLEKSFRQPPNDVHYLQRSSKRVNKAEWQYHGARYAFAPSATLPSVPESFDTVAVLPPYRKLIVELGDQVGERGTLRVRVLASRGVKTDAQPPSLRLEFGWKASNDSRGSSVISDRDHQIDAPAEKPQFYQWDVPISQIHPRNGVRNISKMGDLPTPSEFIRLINSTVARGYIYIHYVEVTAPLYPQWPPQSHQRIFFESKHADDETEYAKAILQRFMSKAWRRPVTAEELERKLSVFHAIRPQCDQFEDAVVEVLATVLSSPHFLFLSQPTETAADDWQLASRLAMFLWCGLPDQRLTDLAAEQKLRDPNVLREEVQRMLADPRAQRFSKHFVRQWLGLQLLDYLKVDRKVHRGISDDLIESMAKEPIAMFEEVLANNHSVLDFLHADYTVANERLARHYGIHTEWGNDFRRIDLSGVSGRGGLLTQAGLLAMNSDGKDSHPLKRGIWLLETILNDPPPPPPPAVPVIDLADPEILKLTLKQRIENHRDQAACRSCHQKIDPWGIALENFDAVGRFRDKIDGKPVDASSELFNGQVLTGAEGLKRFLLSTRQDQFVRSMVYKLSAYGTGRPLTFSDRSEIESITANVRQQGDGLATLIEEIVLSDLFLQSKRSTKHAANSSDNEVQNKSRSSES